jgi:Zn-dependent alcohol dehydrogenase
MPTCCLIGALKDGPTAQARLPLGMLLSKQTITGSVEGDAVAAEFIPYLVSLY